MRWIFFVCVAFSYPIDFTCVFLLCREVLNEIFDFSPGASFFCVPLTIFLNAPWLHSPHEIAVGSNFGNLSWVGQEFDGGKYGTCRTRYT